MGRVTFNFVALFIHSLISYNTICTSTVTTFKNEIEVKKIVS